MLTPFSLQTTIVYQTKVNKFMHCHIKKQAGNYTITSCILLKHIEPDNK